MRAGLAGAFAILGIHVIALASGCAQKSYLEPREPVTPTPLKVAAGPEAEAAGKVLGPPPFAPFADSLIGFAFGSADSTRRYLGRLSDGYVVDTLNLIIFGDNRPGWKSSYLRPQGQAILDMASLNPWNWLKGLVAVPVLLVKGTIPSFTMWREIPDFIANTPEYGREEQVLEAVVSTIDSLAEKNQHVAALINAGDLVEDGRFAEQWERFLDITRPVYSRVPYMPVAGNHERTESSEGLANWHTATGLPIRDDRLYYCFDSADGWVRFIALDSNPLTDPGGHWPRDVEVAYTKEQIDWLSARLGEHTGPAIVLLHHPPFSAGFHRVEWQTDDMLRFRRAELVRVLRESKLALLVSGHEHAYQRALMTCDDNAVIVNLVVGGAGSPLHDIPMGDEAASLFASYGEIAGCEFQPADVFVNQAFNFVHMRFWFGGGELFTYAVDEDGRRTLIDEVKINLERFGVPTVDQHKMPVPSVDVEEPPPSDESPEGTGDTPAGSPPENSDNEESTGGSWR